MISWSLCLFVSSGTESLNSLAGVPGLGLYENMKLLLQPIRSIIFIVSWNWASVSPGNPTIISVVKETPGTSDFNSSISSRYSSTVWSRRMDFKTSLFPLWIGRCKWFTSTSISRYARIVSRVKSFGWLVVNLNLCNPGISSILYKSLWKGIGLVRPRFP